MGIIVFSSSSSRARISSILGILITVAPGLVIVCVMCGFRWRRRRRGVSAPRSIVVVFIADGVVDRIVGCAEVFVVVFGRVCTWMRVPGLCMGGWRRRCVVRIRGGIPVQVIIPHILAPVLVHAIVIIIMSSSSGLASGLHSGPGRWRRVMGSGCLVPRDGSHGWFVGKFTGLGFRVDIAGTR